jgi:hypothetical protein
MFILCHLLFSFSHCFFYGHWRRNDHAACLKPLEGLSCIGIFRALIIVSAIYRKMAGRKMADFRFACAPARLKAPEGSSSFCPSSFCKTIRGGRNDDQCHLWRHIAFAHTGNSIYVSATFLRRSSPQSGG